MVKIQCLGCKRIVDVEEDWKEIYTCSECGEDFKQIEPELEEEEEEYLNSEGEECPFCGKDLENENYIFWDEDEFETDFFEDFKEIGICKSCIDKKYPRETKIIEKPVFIQKEETNKEAIDFEGKTKFD